jgi:hypothetical protein
MRAKAIGATVRCGYDLPALKLTYKMMYGTRMADRRDFNLLPGLFGISTESRILFSILLEGAEKSESVGNHETKFGRSENTHAPHGRGRSSNLTLPASSVQTEQRPLSRSRRDFADQ